MLDKHPCLLILSDTAGLEALESTGDMRWVALRPDQRDIDSVALLNADTGFIERIVILKGERPFIKHFVEGCLLFEPNIATVIEVMDPIEIDPEHRRSYRELNGIKHRKHHEVVTIADWDELENVAIDRDQNVTSYLCIEIEDQMILNRRDVSVESALRHLEGEGDDKRATRMEHEATSSLHLDNEPITELPQGWSDLCEDEEQRASTLALLNSITSTFQTEEVKNHSAIEAEHFDWGPTAQTIEKYFHESNDWQI